MSCSERQRDDDGIGDATLSTAGDTGDARDDVALVAAVAGGDVAALRSLYDRHAPWLVARLRARCWDDALVADAVQDTFVGVWRSAGRWRGDGDVGAWIWGIGVRQLVTHLRRDGRQSRPVPFPVATEVPSTEERVLESIDLGEAGAALASLSPELMEVVQAMVFDGLTAKETGRMLGVPEGTVKGRMRKAKAVLRTELGSTKLRPGYLR